jgi:hypothetical protein
VSNATTIGRRSIAGASCWGNLGRAAVLDDAATVMAVSCITGSRLAGTAVLRLAGTVPR